MRKNRKSDIAEFRKTPNGAKKYFQLLMGMVIDVLGTLGISFLIAYSSRIHSFLLFYLLLFLLLVAIVLGGEFIGIYYGALEQYIYDKNHKKVLDINE